MIGYLRLLVRTLLSTGWILLIIPPLYVTWQLRLNRANSEMMRISFDVGCLIWGVHVRSRGTLCQSRPVLIVSNHFSYLDVFALGGKFPARFITKSEIAAWPIVGFICKIGGCIFIDRRPSKTLHNVSEVNHIVKRGAVISLFPEGTTNDGTKLLSFKSSFFGIAEEFDLDVQPVSVVYTKLNGLPFDDDARPIVGWYGDAFFFPHAAKFLQQRSVEVTLVFHEPINGSRFESRKELARYCHDVVEAPLKFGTNAHKKSAPGEPEAQTKQWRVNS